MNKPKRKNISRVDSKILREAVNIEKENCIEGFSPLSVSRVVKDLLDPLYFKI